MSDGVLVQFAHLAQAAMDIKTGSQDIEQILNDMDTELQKVTWEGEAQAAYNESKMKWNEGMTELKRVLGEVGGTPPCRSTRKWSSVRSRAGPSGTHPSSSACPSCIAS